MGIKSDIPDHLRKFSWIYFPDKTIPFYRATVFSNYSPRNAKEGHWSLLLEVSESPYRKIDQDGLVDDCIRGCLVGGPIQKEEEVNHTWHHRVEYGYPVPGLERDSALEHILAALEEKGILSRGRFGAWKYEVGNMAILTCRALRQRAEFLPGWMRPLFCILKRLMVHTLFGDFERHT